MSIGSKLAAKIAAENHKKQLEMERLKNYLDTKSYYTNLLLDMARRKEESKQRAEKESAEERERLLREAAELERERKTKQYFRLSDAENKKKVASNHVYLGESISKHGAWVPHGAGAFMEDGRKLYQGRYKNGHFEGSGIKTFQDSIYEGNFRKGNMTGIGQLTDAKSYSAEDVLMLNNVIICRRKGPVLNFHITI